MVWLSATLLALCVGVFISHGSGSAGSICPNGCSSHGVCGDTAVGTCSCFPGFTGIDCSLRVCPSSSAWVDLPSSSTAAHAEYTECSNMGACDRTTGLCKCRGGFEGAACDMMMCPVGTLTSSIPEGTNITAICSGNGRCLSLREVTNFRNFETHLDYTRYKGWDADKVHGCVCEPGWAGISCEKRLCPKGDDPVTAVSGPSTDVEVQLIDCLCTSCQGGLYISFQGQQTPLIPYDASAELIQFRFNQFTSLQKVKVDIVEGSKMCSSTGSVTKITFILPQGPQPSLSIVRGGGLKSTMRDHDISVRSKGEYSLIKHTEFSYTNQRELVECSNRGVCDYSTGMCACFDGFRSSNGLGGNGSIPDCGYWYSDTNVYVRDSVTFLTSCPVANGNQICSGNGVCDESTGICTCDTGYGGPACTDRTCTSTFSWFGNVNADHSPATTDGLAECGGVGQCDTSTGVCKNCGGHWGVLHGDRCQYFSCPKDSLGHDCSSNGACLTMYEIGRLRYNEQKEWDPVAYTEPWDAHVLRGCNCYRAISVDGQYDIEYNKLIGKFFYNESSNSTVMYTDEDVHKFYRGPYAFAATDFKGYSCESAWCPKGDNPRTTGGLNEIQTLDCRADNGSFLLSFRENVTTPIFWNATLPEFERHLEQLFTIGDVAVSVEGFYPGNLYDGNICNIEGNLTVYIEFLTEFGDLPLLTSDLSAIQNIDPYLATLNNGYIMNITEYQKGTKEDAECSGQGMCDERTGRCSCFEGFASSNGTTDNPGERGDCSFFNKFYTQKFVRV